MRATEGKGGEGNTSGMHGGSQGNAEASTPRTPGTPRAPARRAPKPGPPNIKLAHRRWKVAHSSKIAKPQNTSAFKRPGSPLLKGSKGVRRRLYVSVRAAKDAGPFGDYFRDLVEGCFLGTNDAERESEPSLQMDFDGAIRKRLDSMFQNLDEDEDQ